MKGLGVSIAPEIVYDEVNQGARKMNINQTDKIAATLAGADLGFGPNDYYHNNIKTAARILVDTGKGDYKYHTQFGSGSCLFVSPDGSDRQIVKI